MKKKKMKTKTKPAMLILLSILVPTAIGMIIFCRANSAKAESNSVKISEALINGPDGKEFIELYNPTGDIIDMSGWVLNYYSKDRGWPDPYRKKYFPADSILGPNEFFLISIKTGDYPKESVWNLGYSSYQMNNADGAIVIFPDENFSKQNAMDVLSWGAAKVYLFEGLSAPENKSLEKIDSFGSNEKENWQESCHDGGTPGEEPELCETITGVPEEIIETSDSGEESAANAPEKSYPDGIILNEILPDPIGNDEDGEFIELFNKNDFEIDLGKWTLTNRTDSSFSFPEKTVIGPKDFLAIYYKDSKLNLHNSDGERIFLKNPDNILASEIFFKEKAKNGQSYAKSNDEFFWTSVPTPGAENIFDATEDEEATNIGSGNPNSATANTTTSENININEILPNPKDNSDEEYIEIANIGNDPINLFGWRLKDSSKSKGYQFKDHIVLKPGGYFVIYRTDSKIALNNSNESVYLLDPRGNIVSSVSFEKSQKNASFNFDGKNWKWSKFLTPGEKNKFDSEPSVKIKKPKKVFKDTFTEFSAAAKDKETKKLKYTWDFGDGKKSYLAKTSHKYLATGKYTVTLSVSDASQTVEKKFEIEVKKYPRPDLEIVKIIPNPSGSDMEGEIVELKNNSAKKVDLANWKIATGTEKVYNHPIIGEINLGPNETKAITREYAKFSLNNKSGIVRLVMPDGKVTDAVEYAKDPPDPLRDSKRAGKIAEDEAYVKIRDEWHWITPSDNPPEKEESSGKEDSEENKGDNSEEGDVLGATNENIPLYAPTKASYTPEDAFIFFKFFGLQEYKPREANFCPAIQLANTLAYF